MTVDFALPKVAVLALVLTPLCAWFLHWSWGRRRLMMSLFVRARLQPELTAGLSRRRPLVKRVLLTAGLALVLLAAARPRWGETEEMAEARGRDIVVCVDVSRSMLATASFSRAATKRPRVWAPGESSGRCVTERWIMDGYL